MTHHATDGELEEAANKALRKVDGGDPDYWNDLGTDREDAKQVAMLAAWEASTTHDGSSPLGAWMLLKAKFSLLDYVRECEADRDRRSITRTVKVGLDDIPIRQTIPEAFIDDEAYDGPQPESPAIQEALAQEKEERAAMRALLNTVIAGCLESGERRVVRAYYGLDGEAMSQSEIARSMGVIQQRVSQLLTSAIEKLRAELRAEEIIRL